MSGDVQPRKRKDKRRKKEGESLGNIHDVPGGKLRSLSSEEREESPVRAGAGGGGGDAGDRGENIHVHHDHGIGGNACVKVIFFALLAVLLGLVGLIFIESRGSTDVDLPSIEDSRFAEYFTGWLDDAPDDHGHDDHAAASGEADDDHDEHDDHDEEETAHSEEDDEGHSEAEDSEDVAASEEEEEDGDNQEVTEESEEQETESVAQDEDDDQVEEDDSEEKENTAEEDTAEEEDSEEGNENEDDGDEESENVDDEDESDEADEEEEYDLTQEDGSEEEEDSVPEPKETKEDGGDSGIASEDNDDDSDDENGEDDQEDSDDNELEPEEENQTGDRSDGDGADDESDGDNNRNVVYEESEEDAEEIEESEEALKEEEAAVKKEKLSLLEDDEDLESISDIKTRKKKERELMRKLEKMFKEQGKKAKAKDADEEDGDEGDAEREETGGVALKLGVGVALVVVAHLVVVRRWRALTHAGEGAPVGDEGGADSISEDREQGGEEEQVVSRRQTLIPESAPINNEMDDEIEEEIDEEGYSEEEVIEEPVKRRTSVDVKRERQDPTKYYTKEELGDSEDLDDEEELGEEEEELGEEELEEEEEEEDFELEGSQTPSELGEPEEEEEDEEEEEEEPPAPPQRAAPVISPRRGPQGVDDFDNSATEDNDETSAQEESEGAEQEDAEKDSSEPKLTEDDDDWMFRQELDFADEQFINNPQSALETFVKVLARAPRSLRALQGRARALDKMAELQRSNALLRQAINAYQTLLMDHGSRIDDATTRQLAARCVDRMRFSGHNVQAASIHEILASRFPEEVEHRNAMAVSFLLAGRSTQAQKVLEETLKNWPEDGFAQVHLGFVLKTSGGHLEEGVQLLEKGLKSNQPGTMDGRFLFHLGDALHRLGRQDEAMKWYELGAKEGVFKSKYQRSLYNVNRLKAQPWWRLEDTTYKDFLSDLERSWKKIREEGLALLRSRDKTLFQDEAESLRDTGDWKQLDLFSRGRKQPGCAQAPFTCQLISGFSPASTCTRGQAKFSVMEPGTHVWPHCGPTNCRLRAHLGLVVPDGVFLRVADETRSWKEGKVLVFDDSFEHEVWHNGSSVRLVLIVDLWHPELTLQERQTLSPI